MDPDECLARLSSIAARIVRHGGEASEGDALALAEAAQALDAWMRQGGFLPAVWRPLRTSERGAPTPRGGEPCRVCGEPTPFPGAEWCNYACQLAEKREGHGQGVKP